MRSQTRQENKSGRDRDYIKIHDTTNQVYYQQTKNTTRVLQSNKENFYNTSNVFKKNSSFEITPNKKIMPCDYNIQTSIKKRGTPSSL